MSDKPYATTGLTGGAHFTTISTTIDEGRGKSTGDTRRAAKIDPDGIMAYRHDSIMVSLKGLRDALGGIKSEVSFVALALWIIALCQMFQCATSLVK